MTVRAVIADGRSWRYAPDEPPPTAAARSQAILQARLVDEVLGVPPEPPMLVSTTVRGAIGRASAGGRVGVVGRPDQAFFAPTIALAHVDVSVAAPGFLPLRLEAPVGAQPGYPDAFAPVDLGAVALHRLPVSLVGRVVSRALGPLVGANVAITGVWPLLAHPPGAASPPDAMPALAGLYADRPAGGTMRRRNLAAAAQTKVLSAPAVAGSNVVTLSDRQAVAAGQILGIEFGDPGRVEYIGIAAIDTSSSADQPAAFELDFPLARDHPEGVAAARAVPGAGGPANAINRAARRGDASIWTAALIGIGAATTGIEIGGGGSPAEFHASRRYVATTDADGAWRLPPLHRVVAAELRVTHAAIAVPVVRVASLAWGVPDHTEDFIVP